MAAPIEEVRLADGEVLIVGAGLAGLFLALKLAPRPCLVLSPAPLGEAAASAWAQGGLAAALAPEDSPALHAADTVAAGAGLVDPIIARLIAEAGPARVRDLLSIGVPFDRSPDGALSQSLEAAHSHPRVVRVAGDLAGRAIMDALAAAIRAAGHVRVVERASALAILQDKAGRAAGVLARDPSGALVRILAGETVLATGGAAALWRVTTNPPSSTGRGLAMAALAGAMIADPEFVQFHPTAIDVARDPAPLATEALRGEGARLVDAAGEAVMPRHHPSGDLAPRDVVARAIALERLGGRPVYLDARAAVGDHFPTAFPTVFAACMAAGLDPRVSLIPVAPAAHYHMGGVATDLWGKTSVERLSAIGECASTGAHGANRLASNSLLEAVVFADRCAERLREDAAARTPAEAHGEAPPDLPDPALQALRAVMEAQCGVARGPAERAGALAWVREALERHGPAAPLVAAAFVTAGGAGRLESRGGHFCPDHPTPREPARRTFLAWDGEAPVDLTLPANAAAVAV